MGTDTKEQKHVWYMKKSRYYRDSDLARYRFLRMQLFAILGGAVCAAPGCGVTDERVLQVDHIAGRGNEDRRKHKSPRTLYAYYVAHPDIARQSLQVLCSNHNLIKKAECKESPFKPGLDQKEQQRPPQFVTKQSIYTLDVVMKLGVRCQKPSEYRHFLADIRPKALSIWRNLAR